MDLFGRKKISLLENQIKLLSEKQLTTNKVQAIYRRAMKLADKRMYYDAAKTGRKRADWSTSNNTPYGILNSDLQKIISRSRQAYDNDAYFHGAINSIVNNTICTGMRPKATVKGDNGKPIKTINKILDDGWKRYNDEWDRRGQITFYEAQRLALRSIAVSGGVLTNTVKANNYKKKLIPIAKQIFEPDRLDPSHDKEMVTISNNDPSKQTLHGINVDEYGMAVSYWIKGVLNPIPADKIIHSFIHERPEQYIGIPWGTSALDSIWDLHQLSEDTLVKSRAIADVVWWMKNNSDAFEQDGDKDESDNAIIESLMMLKTPEKPEIIKGDDTITESVKPLSQMILHSVFSSLGTSYMTVTRDMENVNFAASRTVSVEERRMYKAIQKWFSKSFCSSEWADYVWWMVFTGQIPSLTPEKFSQNPHKYLQCWWSAEGWQWVDPSKDAAAEISMRDSGLKSERQILGDRGIDIEEHYRELAEQKELKKKYGIEDLFGVQTNLFDNKKNNEEGGGDDENN